MTSTSRSAAARTTTSARSPGPSRPVVCSPASTGESASAPPSSRSAASYERRPPLGVDLAHPPHVAPEVPLHDERREDRLVEHRRVPHRGRAQRRDPVHQPGRKHQVAQPQRREEHLAEAAGEQDRRVRLQALERRESAAPDSGTHRRSRPRRAPRRWPAPTGAARAGAPRSSFLRAGTGAPGWCRRAVLLGGAGGRSPAPRSRPGRGRAVRPRPRRHGRPPRIRDPPGTPGRRGRRGAAPRGRAPPALRRRSRPARLRTVPRAPSGGAPRSPHAAAGGRAGRTRAAAGSRRGAGPGRSPGPRASTGTARAREGPCGRRASSGARAPGTTAPGGRTGRAGSVGSGVGRPSLSAGRPTASSASGGTAPTKVPEPTVDRR